MGQTKAINGIMRFGDFSVKYDFSVGGVHKNEVGLTMKFNRAEPEPQEVFIAAIHLLHYLALDFGLKIETDEKPKLPPDLEHNKDKH